MVEEVQAPLGGKAGLGDRARVLDVLATGVIIHDADLHIVYTNRSAAALLGVEISDAIRRNVADPRWVVVHPDGSPVHHSEVPASVALSTGEAVKGMILGVRQTDGVTTWLAVDAVPLLDAKGVVELVAVTISDVTRDLAARIQLEKVSASLGRTILERDAALATAMQALDSSEARYRAVLRAMAEGVAVHAVDGAIVFANPAAQKILGLSLEQMQGQHPVEPAWRLTDGSGEALSPERIPSEITRRTGVAQRNVLLGVTRGSPAEHAWLSVSTDPIDSASVPKNEGRYPVVATFTDVTAERRALADAQSARDHLHEIAAALPGVVLEHLSRPDGSFQFRYVSEPAEAYFGIAPEALLLDASVIWERIHPQDREPLLAQMRASPGSAGIQVEFRILHRDGRYRHARLRSGRPTPAPEGLLWRSVVLDVTEQRRLEETVREAQRREAIGTLAAGMAHNFNNMLAVIVPSLEMVRAEAPPALAADLEDARAAAHAASELVRQLMQLVRKEAIGAKVVVDLGALAEEVSQLCRRTFDAAIEIRCEVGASPSYVRGRRAELQQALVNLCINARDALEGRPSPRLEMRVRSDDEHVTVEVIDNGAGMQPEVQRRLGEPFFSTKAPGRGTGLGLATVFGTVTELGGQLRCQSVLGQGTHFELRLPRQREMANERSGESPEQVRSSGLRVLVIDDEELVRNTLARALTRAGADVLCAASAAEGLALVRKAAGLQLVLLDLAMPDGNGADALRLIRDLAPELSVYVMTGFLPAGVDITGATGVLIKPVDLNGIRALLAAEMARRPARRGPQP